MSYKIITGANDSYILTLLNFINYHVSIGIMLENLIVYDLGLSNENLKRVKKLLPKTREIKKLNYNEYPEHVNLSKYNGLFCSYAFKPIIIYNEAHINNNIPIIWLDCACKISINQLNNIIKEVNINGFYCPIGNYEKTIESIELNHPQTLNLLGITHEEHFNNLQTRLACICGVNYNILTGKTILDDWYKYSLDKNIIMPDGSSRNNHRQDQTVLSALMFLYEKKHNFSFEKSRFNISCWNKLDKSIVDMNYNKYILIQKYNNIRVAAIYETNIERAIEVYVNRKKMSLKEFENYFCVIQE
jgi:hypothetical protein